MAVVQVQDIQDLCFRVYKAQLMPHDAKRVLNAYENRLRNLPNPLLDSVLFMLNNPLEQKARKES